MKYWAYVNNEILGPYEKEKLFELPVFSPATLICPQTPVGEKTEDWKEASTYPEIAAMLQSGAGLAPKPAADAAAPGPKIQLEPVVSPKTALEHEKQNTSLLAISTPPTPTTSSRSLRRNMTRPISGFR